MSDGKSKCKHARVSYGKSQARGRGEVEMGFIRPVEAGIAMMSRAPKTSCPRDPRAQTHKQIPCFHARGNTRNVCEKMISIVDIAEVRSKTIRYRTCGREGAFFRECRGV